MDPVIDPWEIDSQSVIRALDLENDTNELIDKESNSQDSSLSDNDQDIFFDDDMDYCVEVYYTDGDDDLNLPDYDEDAQRSPWETAETITIESEGITPSAKSKAKEISDSLNCRNDSELEQAYDYFLIFFSENTSSRTLTCVRNLADAGIDLETFKQVTTLRAIWQDKIYISWTLAHTICKKRQEYPVRYMIDEQWFLEWKALRYPQWHSYHSSVWSDGYKFWSSDFNWSFARFLEEKLNAPEVEMLNIGFILNKDYDYLFDEIRNSDALILDAELARQEQEE